MSAADARRQLGVAAVVSVAEAATLLPVRDATARAWLRRRGLIRSVPHLGEVVVWGDVLDAVRQDQGEAKPLRSSETPLRRAGVEPRRG